MSEIMNDWDILKPLNLNPDTASSSRSKPAALLQNEGEQVFNFRFPSCTYFWRCEFWAKFKDTIEDVLGYLWSRGWVPTITLVRFDMRALGKSYQSSLSIVPPTITYHFAISHTQAVNP